MKISAIVCSLNAEKFLKCCLDSIIPQADEIILVDANSEDDTLNIAKSYGRKVSIYSVPREKILAYARNYGAKKAKHPLLLFADSDVELCSNWVNEAKKAILNGYASVGGRTKVEGNSLTAKFLRVMRHKEVFEYPYPTRVFLMKRKAFEDSGMFNIQDHMGEDEKLYYRLIKKGYRAGNILSIYETHLGEPESFQRLLKRQKKYGMFSCNERNPPYSFKNILFSLLMLSPAAAFIALRLYAILFRERLPERKDPWLLLTLPFLCYMFYGCYYYYNLVSFLRGNKSISWSKVRW